MRTFPDDATIEALRAAGAEYMVVHGRFYEPEQYTDIVTALEQRADLAVHPCVEECERGAGKSGTSRIVERLRPGLIRLRGIRQPDHGPFGVSRGIG